MSNGTGPKSLPQFEDRFLYHLVDLAGDLPMGHLDGVSQIDVAARLADELRVSHDFIKGDEYLASPVHETILGTVRDLEDEGLLTVPIEETGPWELRPTRSGRQRVAQWHEKWKQQQSKQDREIQRLILLELESQWRADPEMYKLRSQLDVERFCDENDIEESAYLTNAHRLLEQGKINTMAVNEATPASGLVHITETGRKSLEVVELTQRPQRDSQEAWVEVARLKRRLQIAERDLPSFVADYELRQRCEDLLAADAHYDRVIREACVILENRVRSAARVGKSVVGTSLMEQAFSLKKGPLRLSDHDQEQLGAMQIYRGITAFFRNAAGHNLIDTYDQEDALRFVILVDLVLKTLSEASIDPENESGV